MGQYSLEIRRFDGKKWANMAIFTQFLKTGFKTGFEISKPSKTENRFSKKIGILDSLDRGKARFQFIASNDTNFMI